METLARLAWPPLRMRPRRPPAFTLVELLVVIGIIAVLIAIVLPTLMAAKRHAQRLQCAANLRTIGQLTFAYAEDSHGVFPFFSEYTATGMDHFLPIWFDAVARQAKVAVPAFPTGRPFIDNRVDLADYIRNAPLVYERIGWLQCPSFPNDAITVDFRINACATLVPELIDNPQHAFNRPIHKFRTSASETVLYTEANALWGVERSYSKFIGGLQHIYAEWQLPGGSDCFVLDDNRHGGLINMCFFDGHVAAKPYKDLKIEDFVIFPD